ncbi:hypothetical protein [Anaerocolumna chitinilytica]|uniref:Copper amine oxidase-like N-terminal domain-containing protein n=1 Tax=Anaerocolumna chitinilytica TaxID=1727145 RepID=A0A7I8DHI9_9FIRM|nr:hypothetical protein [Anaerocolumna chitinilytica]BCJ97157.1 hypothetical protein bsdcttw_01980 [Anaerocolumna chitinilytica]
MNYTSSAPQGMIFPGETIIHVDNALIEEVAANTESTGYILIYYEVSDENNMTSMQEIRLNVANNTIIIDEKGISLNMYDLQEGMRIDADFSSAVTRSIPPQSSAYRILVLQEEASFYITTDRVVSVDTINGLLLTGNPYDMYDQMMFNISDETMILDQNGNAIPLEAIQPGQKVRVEHAIYETLSIPPQSPAYLVQVL